MVEYYSKPIENNITVYDSILFEKPKKYQISDIEYESKKFNVYQKQYNDLIIAVQLHNEQSLGMAGGLPFLIPMIPLGGKEGYGTEKKDKNSTPCFFVSLAIKKVSDDVDPIDINPCDIMIYNNKENGSKPSGYFVYHKLEEVFNYGNPLSKIKIQFKECNNSGIRICHKDKLTKIIMKYDILFIPQDQGRILIPPIGYKGKTINIDLVVFKKGTVFFYSPCCIPAG